MSWIERCHSNEEADQETDTPTAKVLPPIFNTPNHHMLQAYQAINQLLNS